MNNQPQTAPAHDYRLMLDQIGVLMAFNDISPSTLITLFYLIQDLMSYGGSDTITSERLLFKSGRFGGHVLVENVDYGL